MELVVLITLLISAIFTVLAFFASDTKRIIYLLILQAGGIGFFALMTCIVNLVVGLQFEALITFFMAFSEWFSCAIISPLIIYWGMVKTKNQADKPSIGFKKSVLSIVLITILSVAVGIGVLTTLPSQYEVLPFTFFIFAVSMGIIVTRKDPIKILVAFNMAETALYPMMVKSPIGIIPFMLAIMIFTNIVGVFVISEAYKEYGSLSINDWSWKE
ncbi:MAG: hypothetical protein GX638_02480 [Crenarchaeota archaeon]|nr:hypothetical protein [Thermoproteota archaeon]